MKNNYNFKINPTPLDKKGIDKHKDFDALMKKVQSTNSPPKNQMKVASKPLYYWLSGIAATLLIGFLAFNSFFASPNTNIGNQETLAYLASQPYVNPPIESLAEKPMTFKVDANEGGIYDFPSGSRMVVPKAAFANSYGALIEGEVEIHFKEYHDYVDFFLSGIPMEIKADGQNQVLESAGMVEVYATQNGERLQMLPEKEIEVELKSKIVFAGDTPPDFNIYFLDEEEREWSLEGKDEIEVMSRSKEKVPIFVWVKDSLGNNAEGMTYNLFQNRYKKIPLEDGDVVFDTTFQNIEEFTIADHDRKIRNLELSVDEEIDKLKGTLNYPKKPEHPERYDGNSLTFELDFLKPDLGAKNYEGTIFQLNSIRMTKYSEEDLEKKLEEIAAISWEKQNLEKVDDDDFKLKLTKGNQFEILRVKPVLVGRDYDKAVAQFETQVAEYQKEVAKIEEEVTAKKKEIEARIAIEKENENKNFQEKIAALREKGHNSYATNEIIKKTVINRFQINRFGIWNCDRPRPPYLATLDGTFQDQEYNRYKNRMVYQTDKSQNTVRRFYLKDMAKNIQYNTESDNLIWLVTDENKLAVFYPEYFERIQQTDGDYAFELDLQAQEINSEADVRQILRL